MRLTNMNSEYFVPVDSVTQPLITWRIFIDVNQIILRPFIGYNLSGLP